MNSGRKLGGMEREDEQGEKIKLEMNITEEPKGIQVNYEQQQKTEKQKTERKSSQKKVDTNKRKKKIAKEIIYEQQKQEKQKTEMNCTRNGR